MAELSLFQKKCEEVLMQRLKALGINIEKRIFSTIKDERWSADEEIMIQASIGNIDFWIYDDGADIRTGQTSIIFESPDYDSEDDLINAFVEKIILLLGKK